MGLGFFYNGRNQHELAEKLFRRAFVTTIYEKLKSPINVLRGYARVFNDPNFQLKPEEHSLGIGLSLARNLAKLMGYEVTLDTSYTQGARFVVSGL